MFKNNGFMFKGDTTETPIEDLIRFVKPVVDDVVDPGLVLNRDGEAIFTYDANDPFGPNSWGRISSKCDGKFQSPVALFEGIAKDSTNFSKPLIIDGFSEIPLSVTAINNGHSAAFKLNYQDGRHARILGGPLRTAYNIDNIHFHWGEHGQAGSEHILNARRYKAEVHVVCYNSKYGEQ